MNKSQIAIILLSLSAIFSTVTYAAQNDNIVFSVEDPKLDSIANGVTNLRGWAVSPEGIDYVEYYLDGVFQTRVPYGGTRNDIGNAFPGHPNSSQSGYSMAVNYSAMSTGFHTLRIVVYDQAGDSNEQTVKFRVVRFDNPFIADTLDVRMLTGPARRSGNNNMQLLGAKVEGIFYSLVLGFKRETQSFSITQIQKAGYIPESSDGIWKGYMTPFSPWVNKDTEACYGAKITIELSNGEIKGKRIDSNLETFDISVKNIGEDGLMVVGEHLDGLDRVARFTGSITGFSMQGTYNSDVNFCGGYWHAYNY